MQKTILIVCEKKQTIPKNFTRRFMRCEYRTNFINLFFEINVRLSNHKLHITIEWILQIETLLKQK